MEIKEKNIEKEGKKIEKEVKIISQVESEKKEMSNVIQLPKQRDNKLSRLPDLDIISSNTSKEWFEETEMDIGVGQEIEETLSKSMKNTKLPNDEVINKLLNDHNDNVKKKNKLCRSCQSLLVNTRSISGDGFHVNNLLHCKKCNRNVSLVVARVQWEECVRLLWDDRKSQWITCNNRRKRY